MNEITFWPKFLLAALATWRITHLLANEDGPADLIVRLRARLGDSFVGQLMDCFYCLSIWVAAPLACFVGGTLVDLLFIWLALSGAACLLERSSQEPVVMHPISQGKERGNHDGMLWSETRESQAHFVTDAAFIHDNASQPASYAESSTTPCAGPTNA